jgi:ribonucleoside-triphosphate reductase
MVILQSLSINLPRIAYQSNKDETYFRARMALLLKPLLSIIIQRTNNISDSIQKGNIPLIAKTTSNLEIGQIRTVINLVGINEAVYNILGYKYGNEGNSIVYKVIQTAIDIINEQSKGFQNSTLGITMLTDESSNRFKNLDNEKYGKSVTISENYDKNKNGLYSQGFQIKGSDILSNNLSLKLLHDHYSIVENILQGNLSIDLELDNLSSHDDIMKAIEFSLSFPFSRICTKLSLCDICGRKSQLTNMKICQYCGSQKISILST